MGYPAFLSKVLDFIKRLLTVEALICLGVAITFIFKGKFSFLAYSERLFWVGVTAILVGGVIGFGVMFAGRSMGIPLTIRRPAEAKRFLDHFGEYREEIEKRYDASFTIWAIGLVCIGLSALVQTLLG